MSQQLTKAVVEIREEDARRITQELLEGGTPPLVVLDAYRAAMEEVGQRFARGEYFIPELIMAGEMLKEATDTLKPRLVEGHEAPRLGKVLIGTVEGDIHDIGKDIVTFMLDVSGFEVHDLGVDVSPARFVEATREVKPHVIGLSGFLTLAYDSMKATVTALAEAGLRDTVKVMVGGSQVTDEVCRYAGADAYGVDAQTAVALSKKWVGGQ